MAKDVFLRGALILTVAGVIVKVLGVFYRIPFTRMVGSEGIGLYQMAYPIYAIILALSTSGIPTAVSYIVAEKRAAGDYSGARSSFFFSLAVLLVMGVFFSFFLFRYSRYFALHILSDARAYYPLLTISPAILLVSIASAFRGYFQGCQLMWPTALSQVVEQSVRVVTVLLAAFYFMPKGVELAAAGATFGAVSGGFCGLLVLVLVFLLRERGCVWKKRSLKRLFPENPLSLAKKIVAYAFPISVGSLVMPLVQSIDTVIIPKRLQDAGCSVSEATSLFGQLSGMAGSIVFVPVIFTLSLATSLVPAIAAAYAGKREKEAERRITAAVRMTLIICFPAAVGIALLATPIMTLLFADPAAGEITCWLAPAALFAGLYQTTSGSLQGLACTWVPVLSLIIGCLFKVFCNYYLTALPFLGVKGAALGSVLCFMVAFILNDLFLRMRLYSYRGFSAYLPRILLAVTIMGIALIQIYGCFKPLGNGLATGAAILSGAFVYFMFLHVSGEMRLEKWRRFLIP